MTNYIEQNQDRLDRLRADVDEAFKSLGDGSPLVILALLVINLEHQSDRIIAIAKDSRFDADLEAAAEQCDVALDGIVRMYDQLRDEPHNIPLKRMLLGAMRDLGSTVRHLSEAYFNMRSRHLR